MAKVLTKLFEREVAGGTWVHCVLKINPETYSGHLSVSYSGPNCPAGTMIDYNTEVIGSSYEEAIRRVNSTIKMDISQKVGVALQFEPFKL